MLFFVIGFKKLKNVLWNWKYKFFDFNFFFKICGKKFLNKFCVY